MSKRKNFKIETLDLENNENSRIHRINRLQKLNNSRKEKSKTEAIKEREQIYSKYRNAPFRSVSCFKIYTKNIWFLAKITGSVAATYLISGFFFGTAGLITSSIFYWFVFMLFVLSSEFQQFLYDKFEGKFPEFKFLTKFDFKDKFCYILGHKERWLFLNCSPLLIEKKILKKLKKHEEKLLKDAHYDDLIEVLEAEE